MSHHASITNLVSWGSFGTRDDVTFTTRPPLFIRKVNEEENESEYSLQGWTLTSFIMTPVLTYLVICQNVLRRAGLIIHFNHITQSSCPLLKLNIIQYRTLTLGVRWSIIWADITTPQTWNWGWCEFLCLTTLPVHHELVRTSSIWLWLWHGHSPKRTCPFNSTW